MRRYTKLLVSLAIVLGIIVWIISLAGIHIGNRSFIVNPQRSVSQPATLLAGRDPTTDHLVEITGRVIARDGRRLPGTMISAFDKAGAYRLTVYADQQGMFKMNGRFADDRIALRARAPGFGDVEHKVDTPKAGDALFEFVLDPLSEKESSDTLTASAHAAGLSWPDPDHRSAFVSQCHFCHQIGNELTRSPRDTDAWSEVVDRMEGYLVTLTRDQKQVIKDTLANTFKGNLVTALRTPEFSPQLPKAQLEEWSVGDGQSFIHDTEIGADGRLYGVDEGHDVIWIKDIVNGKVLKVPLPVSHLPVGGLFSGLALPIGIFEGRHGPHSLAQSKDGRFWITNALSSTLMSYDPEKHAFAAYSIGRDALYPHTIRIDSKGMIWFTLAASNQVARFQPVSGRFTLIDLPSNGTVAWISDLFMPLILKVAALFPGANLHLKLSHHTWFGGKDALNLPYGIDIHPADGSIWYAKLNADRIGRIDAKTLEIKEFETPLKGPRRPRFDAAGHLWIPAFEAGEIMRFDTDTLEFKSYKLPQLGPGEYETPYALNANRETGAVWITSNQSDRIFMFNPNTEQFVVYPSPTRVTFLRDLVFSRLGHVCSSSSNLPASAIEGGRPSFICLNPSPKKPQ